MRRLFTTMRCDVISQARYGFYIATAFVLVVCAVAISRLPALNLRWLLPPFVLGNLLMTAFYFIGGLILLEKSEGVLDAQAVTPLRTWEYLASKICTLTLLGLIENLVFVILFVGFRFSLPQFSAGVLLTSALYCLAGVMVVVRYDSINQYLMPSALYTALLSAPLAPYFIGWDHWLLYLHPVHAALLLTQSAFQTAPGWLIAYGILYPTLWIGLLATFSLHAFQRFIIAEAGME
jgi:fluoroquinolone transport system permease protein